MALRRVRGIKSIQFASRGYCLFAVCLSGCVFASRITQTLRVGFHNNNNAAKKSSLNSEIDLDYNRDILSYLSVACYSRLIEK